MRYRLRFDEKAIITVGTEGEKKTPRRRGPLMPDDRVEYLKRRVRPNPHIRFWDLAQVNHDDPASPVWVDHPILKTPEYTTEANSSQTLGHFGGVNYIIDPFDDSDFAAYTEMFFNYPVSEWTQRYRRFLPPQESNGDNYIQDARLSLWDSALTPRTTFEKFIGELSISGSISTYNYEWNTAVNKVQYSGPADLSCNIRPLNGFGTLTPGGYLPFSTGSSWSDVFKVTTVKDPDASSAGVIPPSGTWDVFLFPTPSLILGTTNATESYSTDVWGICYQIQPRYRWPRYVDAETNESGAYGADADLASFINYQSVRSGMQSSRWTFTGDIDTLDLDYTEEAISPTLFPSTSKYGLATHSNGATTSFFGAQARGFHRGSDTVTNFNTFFQSTEDDDFGQLAFMRSRDPLLTAVIKAGGVYYYVWDINHQTYGSGNWSSFQIQAQNDRFRMWRGITWSNPSNSEQPKDGTGVFWDI